MGAEKVMERDEDGSAAHRRLQQAYEDRVRALNSAIQDRERELVILSHASARIHGAENMQEIFDIALEEILVGLRLNAAWIFIGDVGEQKLRLAASRGVSPTFLEEVRVHGLEECLCPEVFWTGHRMQARNTTHCPRMPDIITGLDAPVAHACIPLQFDAATRGVLNVAARPAEVFSEEELRFLDTLGHQISLAVARGRHREAERLRNQEARAMAAISKAVGGSLEPQAVLAAVASTAREVLGADRVYVFLGAEAREVRVEHVSGGDLPGIVAGETLDLLGLGWHVTARALADRELQRIDDRDKDARVNRAAAVWNDARAALMVPLVAREHVLGVLVVTRPEPHAWTEEQVEVAEALAAQAAVALENARLYDGARRALQDLRDAQQRVIESEKMAVLGTFASGLAHEVRNPLNSMGLQLAILERRIRRLEPDRSKEMSEITGIIRDEIQRLDSLVGDFLMFSRTNRLHFREGSLEAVVDEVVRLVEPEAQKNGVSVRRQSFGEPIADVRMDVEKMKQVVLNLVRNAMEAMPEGGTVHVETGGVDGRARVVVQDTGPGLPPGLDIFQIFVTTKAKGTGLGLSIVQQIVMQHGGEITASSEPGKGARFELTLPVSPGTPSSEEAQA
jgi:signal transduction histidine kinase